jgi:hypothetical protein
MNKRADVRTLRFRRSLPLAARATNAAPYRLDHKRGKSMPPPVTSPLASIATRRVRPTIGEASPGFRPMMIGVLERPGLMSTRTWLGYSASAVSGDNWRRA